MAKTSKFRVPESERNEFDRMVQRANRRILSNMKYLQQEAIQSEATERSLLGDYSNRSAWHSQKTPLSRSKVFSSEKAYKQYKRHVAQWGSKNAPTKTVDSLKKGYYENIIKALTTAAIDNNIPLENGKLPGNVANKIKGLTLEQLTHFFENSEPVDDLEYLPYSDVDFNGVDTAGYIDNVDTIINSLQQIYPNANQRKYNKLVAQGLDAKSALKQIFPKATARQISYYASKNGRIPEQYKAPRKRSKKRKSKKKK